MSPLIFQLKIFLNLQSIWNCAGISFGPLTFEILELLLVEYQLLFNRYPILSLTSLLDIESFLVMNAYENHK